MRARDASPRTEWSPEGVAPLRPRTTLDTMRPLRAAVPGRAEWWVRERLVMLTEHVGTPALVPSLVELALATGHDASLERTSEEALSALAALAGFDARTDVHGSPRPVADVAADYARACRR